MIDDKRRRIPRLPFFKDERVGGTGMSTAQAMRLFIISSVVFAVVIAAGAVYLVNVGAKTDKTARTAAAFAKQSRELVDELKAVQDRNHQSRIDDQARTDREVHELACAFVAPYPDTIPLARTFRHNYGCPPYDPKIAKLLKPAADGGASTGSSKHAPSVAPGGGASTAGRTTRVTVPGSTVTRTHTAPAPPPPRATTTRPAPILPPLPLPLPLPSPVCNPIGLLHLC